MKLGILADIHEKVADLRLALECLRHKAMDRIVVLGDLAESGGTSAKP
jgi:predicted phosphodiesterase